MAKKLELQLHHQSSNEYSGLVSFRIDWFDLLGVQGTLKGLLEDTSLNFLIGTLEGTKHPDGVP